MLEVKSNYNLKALNTFGLDCIANYFVEINQLEQLTELKNLPIYNLEKLILGGGSNILFTKNFEGLVIKISLRGISLVQEDDQSVIVEANAGENWHEFVMWCIEKNYCGLENLSLIPGCVGASPMQNIGAYGVEIKDVFYELTAWNLISGEFKKFSLDECKFGYRESVFKRELKNQFLITSVKFKLTKNASTNTTYGAINSELEKMGISSPSIKDVSDAVTAIRTSKLPNPKEIGNAGSFFKNPEIENERYNVLKIKFPNIVAYPLDNGNVKLAAGWLIEHCGLKGFEHEGAAVHSKQALVLINKNNSTGKSIFNLSTYVMQKVFDTFGVNLEREVNII